MHNSILFVAPDSEKRLQLFKTLWKAGFPVRCFLNPDDVFDFVRNDPPALILIQNRLPKGNTVQFISALREFSNVQVAVLVSDFEESEISASLQAGADTFLPWSISSYLFLDWIKALFRRISRYTIDSEQGKIFFRGFVFHEKGRYLEYHQQKIRIASKEFDVLQVLLKNPGKQLTSKYIYSQVWGEVFGDISTVGVHIKRIKLKLARYDKYPFITNVYRSGYMFDKKCLESVPGESKN